MKTRILGLAIGFGALWLWAPGCSQPEPLCTIGTASASAYVAKYTLIDGDENSPCGAIPGDTIGLQQYNPPDGDVPDTSVKYLAIQATTLGRALIASRNKERNLLLACPDATERYNDPNEAHHPYAYGKFNATDPDSNDLCTVPVMDPAQLSLPEVEAQEPRTCGEEENVPVPAQTARDLAYDWSDVNIYVTPALPGNQMEATLKYTEDGCSATYHVVGLWPNIDCEKMGFFRDADPDDPADPDDEVALCDACDKELRDKNCVACDPSSDTIDCEEKGTCCTIHNLCDPEPKLCDSEPDPEPEYQLASGSGIAPDLQVACDPDLLKCVLNSMSIPAIK
jgi:hypothetical protein